jgi:ATP-dependent Clp protease ATP-binding subunit ClpA
LALFFACQTSERVTRYLSRMTNNVNVDEIVNRIRNNDPSLTIVNLNSHLNTSKDPANPAPPDPATAHAIAEALKNNTHVIELHMANCNVDTGGAKAMAEMLLTNRTLAVLNLETNNISGEGIQEIFKSLSTNQSLTELKLANQSKSIGNEIERSLAKLLEANQNLQKLSLDIREQSTRNSIDKTIMRNKEIARKKRQAKK